MNSGAKHGASGAWTLWGPPERMIALGFKSAMDLIEEVPLMQREKTLRARIRRVMRWVYWEPKSRIRTRLDLTAWASIDGGGRLACRGGGRRGVLA